MSRIVITGANGFLGSNLTRLLIQQGHNPILILRKTSDVSELEGLKYEKVYGDVTDLASLENAFKGADTVFHLAGLIAYKKSERDMMNKVNVEGTANVLKACHKNNVRKLVYMSSVVAIGAGFTPYDVLNETSAYKVHHLNLGYFETKHRAEKLVIEAFHRGEVDPIILNPSTIYGAGDAKKGSRKFQLKVAQGKFPIYPSGGVCIVDVEDVMQATLTAWKVGRSGERYILGGENLTIKNVFDIIAEQAGVPAPRIPVPAALLHAFGSLGDKTGLIPFSRENAWSSTLYHWFDHQKAAKELNFKPRPARESLEKSVTWMKNNGYLK